MNKPTRFCDWIAWLTRKRPTLCPACIWRFNERGQIIEVIDCQTLNTHKLKDDS